MKHTKLITNLTKISQNINDYKKNYPDSKIIAIVKANAYGLGAASIAPLVIKEGCHSLGIARVFEGKVLRNLNLTCPILLLSEPPIDDIPELISLSLTPTVYTPHFIETLNEEAKKQNQIIPVHLKVNTGMNRFGCHPENTIKLAQWIESASHLTLEGLYTHFADADTPNSPATTNQLNLFKDIIQTLSKHNIHPPTIHAANTNGAPIASHPPFNALRIGLGLYQNACTYQSYISHILDVKKGASIGYNGTYIASEDCKIAVIAAGYADGLPTQLSNNGSVIIQNTPYPIVGKICMDACMVKLPLNTPLKPNTPIYFLNDQLTLEKLSTQLNIDPRALLCQLGQKRIKFDV